MVQPKLEPPSASMGMDDSVSVSGSGLEAKEAREKKESMDMICERLSD